MIELLEQILKMNIFEQSENLWHAWWIVKGKLIDIGSEYTGGDHYGTIAVAENPGKFGLTKEEQADMRSYIEELEKGEEISKQDRFNELVSKVILRNIRIGLHKTELSLDLPNADSRWLQSVQLHREAFERVGNITNVFVELSNKRYSVRPQSYLNIPPEEFWGANTMSDLRAYKF